MLHRCGERCAFRRVKLVAAVGLTVCRELCRIVNAAVDDLYHVGLVVVGIAGGIVIGGYLLHQMLVVS